MTILKPTTHLMLPSAARTSTQYSAFYDNPGYRGMLMVITVSAGATGTDTLAPAIQVVDPITNGIVPIVNYGAVVNGNFSYRFALYPGSTSAGGLQGYASQVLPSRFCISITHATAASITYSVGIHLLP